MGEGAAAVLARGARARPRAGGQIYAELVGYGISSDASHMTEPDPDRRGPARAMTMALADAGVDPTEVGYVNAHATSTPLGDAAETRVIKRAFGEEHATTSSPCRRRRARRGIASALPARSKRSSRVLAIATGRRRRRSTTSTQIPNCDLDYVPNVARDLPDLDVAVSNSFGFGGHNASIVVRRFES